ncbi:DUF402 domain-containing protein [Salininema proteolyticum]|uniref:DUF402 domain-containing protein n=1 Tax=Salininema proteolyticum TaxID=1607685 RepID=A0ABV8U0E0_9ACTN
MRFDKGQSIVRRYLHADGRIGGLFTARVVDHTAEGLLTWTAIGSDAMWRTTVDGKAVRHFSFERTLSTPTVLSHRAWHTSNVLAWTPKDSAHSVWWFFDEDMAFSNWYVNLERPLRIWELGYDCQDLDLDVVVRPDLSVEWKDEDEFAERIGHPAYYTAEQAEGVRREGERMAAVAAEGAFPFDGTHTGFRPEPDWEPARLPVDWDLPVPGLS